MKKFFPIMLLALSMTLMIGCGNDNSSQSEPKSLKNELNSQEDKTEKTDTKELNSEQEHIDNKENTITQELTEEEYKALCSEKYYDDFFKSTPNVGEHVKIHALTSQKYKYSSGDMQGILTEDITKQYNLALNSLGCCVLHEETKNNATPSYYGKHIYIMFIKDAELNLDSFKTGQNVIIYGEIIKNNNGVFVLPKYIEKE